MAFFQKKRLPSITCVTLLCEFFLREFSYHVSFRTPFFRTLFLNRSLAKFLDLRAFLRNSRA
ncbi:hypothetical protein WH47_08762 [Habropoda laboriosa]|uniref:Uncharacterized protein n=1 Tax=Habropoda laboriosa TaxID=597456 RepID=A0A0L7R677_9HYME|nr:hypothetical protein WH47_08762 [Habropoda laboriosa]